MQLVLAFEFWSSMVIVYLSMYPSSRSCGPTIASSKIHQFGQRSAGPRKNWSTLTWVLAPWKSPPSWCMPRWKFWLDNVGHKSAAESWHFRVRVAGATAVGLARAGLILLWLYPTKHTVNCRKLSFESLLVSGCFKMSKPKFLGLTKLLGTAKLWKVYV